MTDRIDEELTDKRLDAQLLLRLLGYLRPYWRWVALTLVLIVAASATRQAGPFLTGIAVDNYILPGDADGLQDIVLIFVGLLFLQFGIGYGQSWTTNMVGQWAMRDVRMHIFRHLQRLPLRFFDRTPVGRLMARNTNDVDALNEMFTDGMVSIISDVFTIVTILAFVFYMNVELGLLTSACIPVVFAATFWLQSKTWKTYRKARILFGSFSAHLQETISGMEVVQLFSREQHSAERFDEVNDQYLQSRLRTTLFHSIYLPFMELSATGLLALVLWYGSGQVLRDQIEWGVLVAMLQYAHRFFMPVRDIAERFVTVQIAMASSERIFELLDTEPEAVGGKELGTPLEGRIEFRNVWFAYDEEEWVLRDVSFVVVPGEAVAIVGATGAGKSTIINLVCRFYEIQRGAILVDGVDIRDWNVAELRRQIGIVQQDVLLFSGDIDSNICFADPDMPAERAARDVNADRFIEALPERYGHKVAERGSSFSAGQRQLLAFARALAADPDILVLDEATANVDTETEMWIQEAVTRLMRDRTSIVIAHRLSTIRSADKIIVLHHGEVREEGRHEELLALEGIYSRLHRLQYGADIEDRAERRA